MGTIKMKKIKKKNHSSNRRIEEVSNEQEFSEKRFSEQLSESRSISNLKRNKNKMSRKDNDLSLSIRSPNSGK